MMLERYPEIGGIQQIEDVREKQIHDISFKVGTLEEAIAKAAEIKERYGDYVDIYPNVNAVDIVPVGCSKGTGLTYVASYYEQTSAEKVVMTCGIGDSINDIPLLETADCSFTFATVPDAVQNQADVIVTSVAAAIQDIKNV